MRSKYFISTFFLLVIIIGISIFRDYGITIDEPTNRRNGAISLKYMTEIFNIPIREKLTHHFDITKTVALNIDKVSGKPYITEFYYNNLLNVPIMSPSLRTRLSSNKNLHNYKDKDYGVTFELPLAFIEVMSGIDDMRNVFLMRHFLTFFTFWLSVIFFFLLLKNIFKDWRIGLVGAIFLFLTPRIFAHAFFNSKDIITMSFGIICIYSLFKLLESRSYLYAVFHGFTSAVVVDTRIVMIYLVIVTICLLSIPVIKNIKNFTVLKKNIFIIFAYSLMFLIFSYMFWPYLWEDPINNFLNALDNMSKFRWSGDVLYWGNFINAHSLPWHYIPSWIVITTPVFYLLLFIVGCGSAFIALFRNPLFTLRRSEEQNYLIMLLLFSIPLLAVIILRSVLYDGWRHMYFIYPAFLMLVMVGFSSLLKIRKFNINRLLIIATIFNVAYISFVMINYHPFQNVYFNLLAGGDIYKKFDMDYWQSSYVNGVRYVLENEENEKVVIDMSNNNGNFMLMLMPEERKRILSFNPTLKKEYYLTNYRYKKNLFKLIENKHPLKNEIHSFKIGGNKILGIYKPNN